MNGQVAVPSDQSLLSILDTATSDHGMSFSGSIMRRALKTLLHEDLKTCDFGKMVSGTRDIILSRFEADQDHPTETAEDFFIISIAQVLQKMVKSVVQCKHAKDTLTNYWFGIWNCTAISYTLATLTSKDWDLESRF